MRATGRCVRWLLALIPLCGALIAALPASAGGAPQSTNPTTLYLPLLALAPVANAQEQHVVDLTNQYRALNGCQPLALSPELTRSARNHSQDMADHNYFGHDDLAGRGPDWRAAQAGYAGMAGWENIAAGFPTPDAVVSAWYNERPPNDGHRRNMLNCSLTDIGVGYGYNSGSTYGAYWTQDFGIR